MHANNLSMYTVNREDIKIELTLYIQKKSKVEVKDYINLKRPNIALLLC